MHKILKNRVRLIRAMQNANNSVNFSKIETYDHIRNIISKFRENVFDHYVSLYGNDAQKISFSKDVSVKLCASKRTKTTLGRYIRRILKVPFQLIDDYSLDVYCNEVSKYLVDLNEVNSQIKFLSGEKIQDFYRETKNQSCMTGDNSYKVSLYKFNPNKVSLIVYNEMVRALLWTCDDGSKVLDRIYPAKCAGVVVLTEWAIKQGIIRRYNPDRLGATDGSVEPLSDNSVRYITLQYDTCFPYMDTFKYVSDPCDGCVTVSNSKDDLCKYSAIDPDGRLPWESCVCEICGEEVEDEYVYNGVIYCSSCYDEYFTVCACCDKLCPNDDMCSINDYSESVCEGCRDEYYTLCEHCEEYVENDNIKKINREDYCEYCADKLFVQCIVCDDFVLKDKAEKFEGDFYCENCFKEEFTHCNVCHDIVEADKINIIEGQNMCEICAEEDKIIREPSDDK